MFCFICGDLDDILSISRRDRKLSEIFTMKLHRFANDKNYVCKSLYPIIDFYRICYLKLIALTRTKN